jgi:hypothetical protein
MDVPFIASTIIAGVPTIALIWHSLRDYEYPRVEKALFEFRKVVLTLALGIIVGAVANILRLTLPSLLIPIWIPFVVLTGMAVLEESFKSIFLNMKRFQLKFDTTFYGLSLSVGIAATMAFYDNYLILSAEGFISDPRALFTQVMFSIGIVAIHASTGSIIGFGASRGDVFPSLLQAISYRAFYVLLILPFYIIPVFPDIVLIGFAFVVISTVYALYLYWRVYKYILPETLPEDLRKKKAREARKKRISGDREE